MKLVVIGGGNMGAALISGLISNAWCKAGDVLIVEALAARRLTLVRLFPGTHIADSIPHGEHTDVAVIAVKPQDVPGACAALAATGAGMALSIAAGVRIATLQKHLGAGIPVVRSMPNTPALVGHGASAMAGSSDCTTDHLDTAAEILGSVGTVVRVKESQLDAVTGLSGSGPAYIFLVAEALIEAGVAEGLTRDVATTLAHHTIAGAGAMLVSSQKTAPELRSEVTSPGGTTAAGLRALEDAATRAAFMNAVSAATARSVELGSA